MPKTILHKSETRGFADHGWLVANHTFSFADYYDPQRIRFGVLRVLNDDTIAPGTGFGTHPHDNMEIITIPLEGTLEHKDSMGNTAVINAGEIQVMSAGTGITHSEYNKSKEKPLKVLQIWIFPDKKNITPRYDQIVLKPEDRKNKFQQILSPNPSDEGVWIHQQAWFHLTDFDAGKKADYIFKKAGNELYALVISGSFEIENIKLEKRDGLGIWETEKISIKANSQNSELLLMEVPMINPNN